LASSNYGQDSDDCKSKRFIYVSEFGNTAQLRMLHSLHGIDWYSPIERIAFGAENIVAIFGLAVFIEIFVATFIARNVFVRHAKRRAGRRSLELVSGWSIYTNHARIDQCGVECHRPSTVLANVGILLEWAWLTRQHLISNTRIIEHVAAKPADRL
jgi:hypothetical protein